MSNALKNYKWSDRWPDAASITECFPISDKKMKGEPERVELDLYWYNEENIVVHLMTEQFSREEIGFIKELCERLCLKNEGMEYSGKVKAHHVST